MPNPLDSLTDKQKQFVLNLLNGQTLQEAYKNSDYSGSPAQATQVLESKNVQRAIHEMRQPDQWEGKQRLRAASKDAVNLLLSIINDETDEDVDLDLRIDCATDLLDRIGMDGKSKEEVNVGVGLDEKTGEVGQILLEMKEEEKDYGHE